MTSPFFQAQKTSVFSGVPPPSAAPLGFWDVPAKLSSLTVIIWVANVKLHWFSDFECWELSSKLVNSYFKTWNLHGIYGSGQRIVYETMGFSENTQQEFFHGKSWWVHPPFARKPFAWQPGKIPGDDTSCSHGRRLPWWSKISNMHFMNNEHMKEMMCSDFQRSSVKKIWEWNHMDNWLVVSNMFYFPMGIILPIDELIFFRGVAQPPTSIP